MTDLKNIDGIYFVGIGGIGMSALALYFLKGGYRIAGYDRSETGLTVSLSEQGCDITYFDQQSTIPELFRDPDKRGRVLVIYTPAIPVENRIISFFRDNGYELRKRSEILGEISKHTLTIAVAGTHGKTTVSTMTAHILKQSHLDCSAFLGGISKNYDTNLLTGGGEYTVMEADEYDRSFHRLTPTMAVVTSVDADHLDIYGDRETMVEAYSEFCSKILPGGSLFINKKIEGSLKVPQGIRCFTYGTVEGAGYRAENINNCGDHYRFDIRTPDGWVKGIRFPFPGLINVENLTAAIAVTLNCGVTREEILKAALLFRGTKRRFDIRVNLAGLTYIDDYAHHPEEIRACVSSVREYFRGRKITGIFQPHLFTRTRDHAEGFAAILDELDEAILLPVYPAREKPIPGITSGIIFDRMKLQNKRMLMMDEVLDSLDVRKLDVLLTIGAGDIDRLVGPIEEKLKREAGR
jgi:UDP-N-acetylmuramate--alanine ligase